MTREPSRSVVLLSVRDEVEASAIVTALVAEGIDSQATGGYMAGFKIGAPTVVEVRVRECDVGRARALLESLRRQSPAINWDEIDVGQPEDEGPAAT